MTHLDLAAHGTVIMITIIIIIIIIIIITLGLTVPVLHSEAHLWLSSQPAQHRHGPGAGQLRGESDINQKTPHGDQVVTPPLSSSIQQSSELQVYNKV